jgi:hypothetical protein
MACYMASDMSTENPNRQKANRTQLRQGVHTLDRWALLRVWERPAVTRGGLGRKTPACYEQPLLIYVLGCCLLGLRLTVLP